MLPVSIKKNDKKARLIIFSISATVFAAVVFLSKYKLNVDLGFNPHVFALANVNVYANVNAIGSTTDSGDSGMDSGDSGMDSGYSGTGDESRFSQSNTREWEEFLMLFLKHAESLSDQAISPHLGNSK